MTAVAEAALAQTEKETAEAEATAARTDQEAAETALRLAKATAAGQVSDAEARRRDGSERGQGRPRCEGQAADAALIEARAKQKEAEEREGRGHSRRERGSTSARVGSAGDDDRAATAPEKPRRIWNDSEQNGSTMRASRSLGRTRGSCGKDLYLQQRSTRMSANVDDPMVTPHYNARADGHRYRRTPLSVP